MCYYNNVKRTTHNNKREEVQSIKTVIIEYAVISPAVLANKVEKAFSCCLCSWKDIDEDYFEFTVIGVCACDMDELEDALAECV